MVTLFAEEKRVKEGVALQGRNGCIVQRVAISFHGIIL